MFRAGLLITVFAVGMIVGAPLMTMLTLRLPSRSTLLLALGAFAGQFMGWRGRSGRSRPSRWPPRC